MSEMRWWAATSLFDTRRARARATAVVAVGALCGFWLIDAIVDAGVLMRHGWRDALLRPSASEAAMRVLVAALLTLAFTLFRQRARLQLMSSAVEEAADGVQVSDLTGHVMYSNRAVQDIYGFSPEELYGKHVNAMNADPEFASRVILPAIQQTGRWAGELEVKHKDGRTFPIWLTTALVVGPGRTPMAAVGIIRDMTRRREAEKALRDYAERLERATEQNELFADILRHDLLGPASALRIAIETLARSESGSASARTIDSMRRSCARLTELIQDAAKYAKVSAAAQLDFEPLDLALVLQEAIAEAELAHQDRRALVTIAQPASVPVRANRIVREVFANLISNAMKYGPDGGAVTVTVEDAGSEWIVAVADRGAGIADADKQRVFVRFERLHRGAIQGTGLGLAIAKRAVEMHGGRIWVEDNAGGGSVFRVALPKDGPRASAPAPGRPAAPEGTGTSTARTS